MVLTTRRDRIMRKPKRKKIVDWKSRVILTSPETGVQLLELYLSCHHTKHMVMDFRVKLPKSTICEICTAYWEGYDECASLHRD